MTRLVIRLPPSGLSPETLLPWVLEDGLGPARTGKSRLADLPKAKEVTAVVPAAQVLLVEVALPERNRHRLGDALAFTVEDKITASADTVHVALGPALGDGRHAAAVVDKEWVREAITVFEQAGIVLRALWPEICLAPLNAAGWTVVWDGTAGFVRTGACSGMALGRGSATKAPFALGLAVKEARDANRAPRQIDVCVENNSLLDLAQWSAQLGVTCAAGPPWQWAKPPDGAGFNLLQGEFSPAGGISAVFPRLKVAFVLAASIAVLHVGGTFAHWISLTYEKAQIRKEMGLLFSTAFPGAVIVDAPLQMSRNLSALRRAAGQAAADDFMPLLASVVQPLGQSAHQRLKAMSFEAGVLRIDVELGAGLEPSALLERLRAHGPGATLEAVTPVAGGALARYRITAGGRS